MDKYRMGAWIRMTQEGKNQHRGSNMTLVDEALRVYWEARDSQKPMPVVAQALVLVIKACNKWLKIKAGKKEEVNRGLFKSRNELFARRKAAVMSLAREAMSSFGFYLSQIGPGMAEYGELRSQFHYQENRFKTFEKGGLARTSVKEIEKSYEVERQLWLQSGKTSNVAGTHVHGIHDSYNADKYVRFEFQKAKLQPKDRTELKRIMAKPVETLTPADWSSLQRTCIATFPQDTEESTQCKYFKAADRTVALIFTNNAGKLEDRNGVLADTSGKKPIYVMDKYGNLYSDYDSNIIAKGSRYMNHSSLLAGDAVICAGNITIIQGQLKRLDNASGHYRPDIRQLRECVLVLMNDSVDFDQAEIIAMVTEDGKLQAWTWKPGLAFAFAMGHRPPDSVT